MKAKLRKDRSERKSSLRVSGHPWIPVVRGIESYLESAGFRTGSGYIAGVTFGALPFLLQFLWRQNPEQNLVLVTAQERQSKTIAESTEELLTATAGQDAANAVCWFPGYGVIPYSGGVADPDREGARSRTLARLAMQIPSVIVTSLEALRIRVTDPERMAGSGLTIRTGERLKRSDLESWLGDHGFERSSVVEKPGEYAVKGSLVDIYCPAYFDPVRLDFWDDETESIRFFDPLTQKSGESQRSVTLFPCRDLAMTRDEMTLACGDSSVSLHGLLDSYPSVIPTVALTRYLDDTTRFVTWEFPAFRARMEAIEEETSFLFSRAREGALPPSRLFVPFAEWQERLEQSLHLATIPHSLGDSHLHMGQPSVFRGRFSGFAESLQSGSLAGKTIVLSISDSHQKERLEHMLSAYPDLPGLQIIDSALPEGLEWPDGIIFTEKEIFGKSVRKLRVHRTTTEVIESFVDLREGDHVVHVQYGVGRFLRLRRMTVAGTEKDFLELEYAGADKLYVPLESLAMVHRYIGAGDNPRLDFLGKKSSWEKTRKRVSESIAKLAADLLELYAEREAARGYSFPADTVLQEEFEASFPYEETDHQVSAITDVKRDMESIRPMDRLVCGDVGFGKTEVAIRAALKAVLAGKSVVVLCPTTILAFQHFHTFSERFREYPVAIDYVSRFRSRAEIRSVADAAANGKVDIVIGTHVLLSPQFRFPDLGLLVIDEEQRFGVMHKEAIKRLRSNVDVLTMTATPIPRTLHMSLVGIRDISLIETPPANRQKIETYVLEENDEVLHAALKNELERGGQAYVLHNSVKTIEAQALRIRSMYPKARVSILHGQMSEDQIEITMLDFYRQMSDVLVATTIIESGIDIPNVNTLVVLNAHEFGLSQLYQIKGRVGRSDRKAFAYFFYPALLALTETAQKRLNTLQEYDDLGSGFKIAMKDLEIRGAGSLLGAEQSGDVMDVGFELYASMLQDKISELKTGEGPEQEYRCPVIVPQDFYFPDDYISDTRQKMEFYKKLAMSRTLESLEELAADMADRFGTIPDGVAGMFAQEKIRVLASVLRLDRVEFRPPELPGKPGSFLLVAGADTRIAMEKLGSLVQTDRRFIADPRDVRNLLFAPGQEGLLNALNDLIRVLEFLV